jgi:hypothetical protein
MDPAIPIELEFHGVSRGRLEQLIMNAAVLAIDDGLQGATRARRRVGRLCTTLQNDLPHDTNTPPAPRRDRRTPDGGSES